jgi:hypothetical protein
LGLLSYSLLDRVAWKPNIEAEKQQDVHSAGVALVLPRQNKVVIKEEGLELNNSNPEPHVPYPTEIIARTRPPTKVKPIASRCTPCRFAGVPKVQTIVKPHCWPMLMIVVEV